VPRQAPDPIDLPADAWRVPAVLTVCHARDANALLRLARRHGVTNERLAYWTGIDPGEISKRLNGRTTSTVRALDRWERIADGLRMPDHLRVALGIAPLLSPGPVPVPAVAPRGGPIAAALPALRAALDAYNLPVDGPVRPVGELHRQVTAVVRMRLDSEYGRLVVALPPLVGELQRALGHYTGQRRAVTAGLLAQCYRAADAVATKYGYVDLSARIIGLLGWAAGQSGDEILTAAASYVRAEVFFASGDVDTGREMLVRSADRLMPEVGGAAAAAYGALHMRAAVLGGRAGRRPAVTEHIAEARSVAARLADGVYGGTAFGPSSVRIHEVSAYLAVGDPIAALAAAGAWTPPPGLPAERRSHFFVDLARSQAQLEDWDRTRESLRTARAVAPEHVAAHPDVRALLREPPLHTLAADLGRTMEG
jgi:hypothetical protein